MTEIDFDARVTELALAEAEIAVRNAVAQEMRNRFYELFVKPYDDEIEANNARVAQLEEALRADTLSYVQETGDLKPHSHINIQRRTKLVYDKDEVLRELKERHVTDLVRVKEELDVRAFEKRWRDFDWAQVEEVNTPVVALSKLGDIAITRR